MNNTTNLNFHRDMLAIVKKYDENGVNTQDYFNSIKSKSQKEIFEMFMPVSPFYNMCEGEYQFRLENKKGYFQAIASINYEEAKKASKEDDLVLKEGITVPFFFEELLNREYVLENNSILFKGYTQDKIKKNEKGEFFKVTTEVNFRALIENNMVIDYAKEVKTLPTEDNLKKFDVSYEHYSSGYVDAGKTETILAIDVDDSVSISMSRHDDPEDGIYHSYNVDGEDYGAISCSYMSAIEEPGIRAT